ncbi:MAG: hypothetical protein HQK53_17525 [Oligoflexia bacterium]|nr:hypothetical protein [Oligoflexia bacterium]
MRSSVHDILPPSVRKSLKKLGTDIAIARRKRKLTCSMMAERIGVSEGTYLRVEEGNPTVSLGIYAMVLFVLGFGNILGDIIDSRNDEQGLILDEERLPKRVRVKKGPSKL